MAMRLEPIADKSDLADIISLIEVIGGQTPEDVLDFAASFYQEAEDQNPDLQLAALKQAECKKIFTDKATGAHVKRPQLTRRLTSLHTGDVLTGEY